MIANIWRNKTKQNKKMTKFSLEFSEMDDCVILNRNYIDCYVPEVYAHFFVDGLHHTINKILIRGVTKMIW